MTELSKPDRAILIELLELQELIDPQQDRKVHIEALREGYHHFYPHVATELPDEITGALVSYVGAVLDMYGWLQQVLRDPITREVPHEAQCPGFDGNSDDGAYRYAHFLTEYAGRFGYIVFAEGTVNSHGFERDYPRMLEVWRTRDTNKLVLDATRRENSDPRDDAFAEEVLAAG
jgi:uncharacterized protein YfbU (UPF0304 family)